MRTIINITDDQAKILNHLAKSKKLSRAELIRQALTLYIDHTNKNEQTFRNSFGIWQNKNINNIDYQQKLRSEWTDK